jgi:hypothetical protein
LADKLQPQKLLIGLRAETGSNYHSIMCSTTEQRIAEIGRAIDDLARKAGHEAGSGGDDEPILARLAELWALVADLDPEVSRRLAGYQALLQSRVQHSPPCGQRT